MTLHYYQLFVWYCQTHKKNKNKFFIIYAFYQKKVLNKSKEKIPSSLRTFIVYFKLTEIENDYNVACLIIKHLDIGKIRLIFERTFSQKKYI